MPVTALTRRVARALLAACAFACGTTAGADQHPAHASGSGGRTRVYFIASEDVEWNYSPRGRNHDGVPAGAGESDAPARPTRPGSNGVIYEKAIFREYTDATFATLKPRLPEWEHLGLLGPLIRAEVGDTIRIVFKNKSGIRWCSLHPHGLAYAKSEEGAFYGNHAPGTPDGSDFVAPGGTHEYVWTTPERSGPAHGEGSSTMWMYHSHFFEGKDINTGLIGPIVVAARGAARPDGSPADVDREFVTAFTMFDETQSWLFEGNLAKQRPFPLRFTAADPASRRPYLIASINGFIEGSLPALRMKMGERIRWYLFANNNEEDVHTAHWHGQTVVVNHMRSDTVSLSPMSMAVADMRPDNPGTWLLHCHVRDHFEGGMHATFTVIP